MEDAKAKARDAPVDGDALSEKPAAPAAKKKKTKIGPMDSYVQSKKQINDATCNFVLANALITEPEGYKNKFDEAAKLNEQLDNAYDNNDFETVEKVQPKYDAAINRARFEEKLFQSALSAHDYASQKLDDAKKMRQVEKCKKYYKIIKASEEYIEKVPEDDKIVSTDDTEDEVVVEETPINNNDDEEYEDGDDDDDDDEQQLDDAEDETAQPRLSSSFQAGKKSRAGRARKEKKSSAPTTKTSAVVTAPKPKNKGPKVSGVKLKQMLKKTYKVDVTVDGEKKKVDVDMKIEPYYSLSRGSIICDCCNKQIREDNLAMVDATKGLEGTNSCFWKAVPGAAKYDKSLETKIAKDPTKYQNMTWEDDPIEVARCRWEWWRAKRGKFTYFSKAARLVVLVQVSSAAVERIFSQVKYILEQIGDSALEENIECRMMERINKYDEY